MNKMPNKEGLWLLMCSENNYTPDYVAITKRGEVLVTHSEDSGVLDLEVLHTNLINPTWKFIA